MKIDEWRVYDLEESIVASGFPMLAEYDNNIYFEDVNELESIIRNFVDDGMGKSKLESNPHYQRAMKLAHGKLSGEDNFLSGIVVNFNVTASQVWWIQFERYHFAQIVSSMSKMHRLRKMLQEEKAGLNENTSQDTLTHLKNKLSMSDEYLAYNCPMGLELTARISTNYRQLKTIWMQRHNHKLAEWRDFCDWIKSLPLSELIIPGREVGQ